MTRAVATPDLGGKQVAAGKDTPSVSHTTPPLRTYPEAPFPRPVHPRRAIRATTL